MDSMPWKLKRVMQCEKCPWRKDVDPYDIPNGYDRDKHAALASTIADPGSLAGLMCPTQKVMACHESQDAHCVGWLMNQLGRGNNIGMRLRIAKCNSSGGKRVADIEKGDRVRRKLANGGLGKRLGTVQVVYDGETDVLVCWESFHARLAYRSTRDTTEQICNLMCVERLK